MSIKENTMVSNVLKELISVALTEMANQVNESGIEAQKQFLIDVCKMTEKDIDAHISPAMKFPNSFKSILISEYLKGRRYDKGTVKDITTVISSVMAKHNSAATDLNEIAVFEFSMSAKHQTMTGCIRGLNSYEAKNFPGYNKESFIEDNAGRFIRLANEVFDTIENAGFNCFELEEKSYGIYMDLE